MSETRVVHVELGARGYDILIGTGLIDRAGAQLAPLAKGRPVVVVTDETVARLHLSGLERSLGGSGIKHRAVILPAGEGTKDFAHFARLCEDILALGVERRTLLVALGGGVVGDIAGFAAASLLRGLSYAQIPTTLLAQVDSSVGGKTAINSAHGKNLVGAFHQPVLVLADVAALATLPRRELLAGYAEVVKYGLIRDREFFEWLERDSAALLAGDPAALTRAVAESCAHKAAVVAADERESGERQLLNFGHTFAHALESATGFSVWTHGEAVAWGIARAVDAGQRLGITPADVGRRILRVLESYGYRLRAPVGLADLLPAFQRDKKRRQGRHRLVIPRGLGEVIVREVSTEDLASALGTGSAGEG